MTFQVILAKLQKKGSLNITSLLVICIPTMNLKTYNFLTWVSVNLMQYFI
jgi:hypothetical protein